MPPWRPPADAVVVLAGGTGGAKLARGLLDACGERLVVIANTGDDIEIHGAHVAPDPDLCSFWLADAIDARGWGIAGDTFAVMDQLRALGDADTWFALGDRDLAIGLHRRARLATGARLTDALAELGAALGVRARVLPMSDAPVRTEIRSGARTLGLQQFLIAERGLAPIDGIRYAGAEAAAPTPEALAAIAAARAIIIGPSNPILSIGPILALPGMRAALRAAPAPVVAVSPIVGGAVLKGPTAACLRWAGASVDACGVASHYGGVVDALVSDEPDAPMTIPHLATDTTLSDAAARRRVARAVLAFAEELR